MSENKHTMAELKQWQALPLSIKILMTKERIRNWVNEFGEDGVYVSFSGGKDSTVLVDIVRNECGYKNIPLVFVDVPTQYPELKEFVQTFDGVRYGGVEILKPKISFAQVCEKYGFPMISKEVSECVSGARKYLTRLLNEKSQILTDRQTEYKYFYEKVTGTGKYSKFSKSPSNASIIKNAHIEAIRGGTDANINTKYHTSLEQCDNVAMMNPTRGGYDNKYRKVRGIGAYQKKRKCENQMLWEFTLDELIIEQENKTSIGSIEQGQQTDNGEYP